MTVLIVLGVLFVAVLLFAWGLCRLAAVPEPPAAPRSHVQVVTMPDGSKYTRESES